MISIRTKTPRLRTMATLGITLLALGSAACAYDDYGDHHRGRGDHHGRDRDRDGRGDHGGRGDRDGRGDHDDHRGDRRGY